MIVHCIGCGKPATQEQSNRAWRLAEVGHYYPCCPDCCRVPEVRAFVDTIRNAGVMDSLTQLKAAVRRVEGKLAESPADKTRELAVDVQLVEKYIIPTGEAGLTGDPYIDTSPLDMGRRSAWPATRTAHITDEAVGVTEGIYHAAKKFLDEVNARHYPTITEAASDTFSKRNGLQSRCDCGGWTGGKLDDEKHTDTCDYRPLERSSTVFVGSAAAAIRIRERGFRQPGVIVREAVGSLDAVAAEHFPDEPTIVTKRPE